MYCDTLFENHFILEKKKKMTIFTTISIALYLVYSLLRKLKLNENKFHKKDFLEIKNKKFKKYRINLHNFPINNNENKISSKRKLLIDASNLFIKDYVNVEIDKIYRYLLPLSQIFDLYLVVKIRYNSEINIIYRSLEILTNKNIVHQHVK